MKIKSSPAVGHPLSINYECSFHVKRQLTNNQTGMFSSPFLPVRLQVFVPCLLAVCFSASSRFILATSAVIRLSRLHSVLLTSPQLLFHNSARLISFSISPASCAMSSTNAVSLATNSVGLYCFGIVSIIARVTELWSVKAKRACFCLAHVMRHEG